MVKVHVFISGQVQGVGYRFYCRQEMEALGIKGWVKNSEDGRVEAEFEGEEGKVREMIAWCWEPFDFAQGKGSILAVVKNVEVKWEV